MCRWGWQLGCVIALLCGGAGADAPNRIADPDVGEIKQACSACLGESLIARTVCDQPPSFCQATCLNECSRQLDLVRDATPRSDRAGAIKRAIDDNCPQNHRFASDLQIQRCKATIDSLQYLGIAGAARGVVDTVWAPVDSVRELRVRNQIAAQQAKLTDALTLKLEAKADAALEEAENLRWQSLHNSWIESDATYRGAHIVGAEVSNATSAIQTVATEVYVLSREVEGLRLDLAMNRAAPAPPAADAIVRQIDPDKNLFIELGATSLRLDLLILPDPRVPRHRRAYELALEAVSAAMQDSGYAFDRYSFPWQSYLDPSTSSSDKDGAADDGRYGLMVYRPVPLAGKVWRGFFVVLETESYGVQLKSLRAAIDRIEAECIRKDDCTMNNVQPVQIYGGQFDATADRRLGDVVFADSESSRQDDLKPRRWRLLGRSAAPLDNAKRHLDAARLLLRPAAAVAADPKQLHRHRQQLARFATVEQLLLRARALDGCKLEGGVSAKMSACPRLQGLKKAINATGLSHDQSQKSTHSEFDALLVSAAQAMKVLIEPDRVPIAAWQRTVPSVDPKSEVVIADRSFRPSIIDPKVLYIPENFADLRAATQERRVKLREQSKARVFSSSALLELGETLENGTEFPDQRLSALNSVAVEQQLRALQRELERRQPRSVVVRLSEVRDRIFVIELVRRALPYTKIIDPQPDVLLAHPSALHATRGVVVAGPALFQVDAGRTFSTVHQLRLWQSLRNQSAKPDDGQLVSQVVTREGIKPQDWAWAGWFVGLVLLGTLGIAWLNGQFLPLTLAPQANAPWPWPRFWPPALAQPIWVQTFASVAVMVVVAALFVNVSTVGHVTWPSRLGSFRQMESGPLSIDVLGLILMVLGVACLAAFFFALARCNQIGARLRLLVQMDDKALQSDWSAITSEPVLFVRSQVLMTRRTIGAMLEVAWGSLTPPEPQPETLEDFLEPVILGYRDTRDNRERVRIVLAHAIVGCTEKLIYAVFAAACAIGLVWLYPLAHRDEIVLVSLLVIVLASILFIRLQISLERNPFSSRLLCNGTEKFEWNTAVMAALLVPVLISVFSIAVALSPGVLSWSGGLFEPLFSFFQVKD
jgi:hypothetical protein